MRQRWTRALAGVGLVLGGLAQAQTSNWGLESHDGLRDHRVRGSVSFYYRSNELMGDEQGASSFGPQLQLDGSFLGDRLFYSANFAFSRRERTMGESEGPINDGSQMVGGARVGFRVGDKSLFEVEYSNDDFRHSGSNAVLFLSDDQQSSLGGIERGKSYFLSVRNETQIGSVAKLSTSFKYTDHSASLQMASTEGAAPLPDVMPDYLRRLELREHARGEIEFGGMHRLETGLRFLLDQIGIRSASGGLDGEIYESKQLRASSVGFFLQDRWRVMRNWDVQMGMSYEFPGAEEIEQRSEWSMGLHRKAGEGALQYGVNAFLRNGFQQLADFGRNSPTVGLAGNGDSVYRDQLGLGGAQTSDYGGVELFFVKPLLNSFGFFFSYTFSHLRESKDDFAPQVVFGTVEADVPSVAQASRAPAPTEAPLWQQTHLFHLNASYRLGKSTQLGSTVNYLYAESFDFVTAEATPLISPHTVSVDVHVEKTVRVGNSQVGLMFDVFNLLDMGSLVAYDTRYDLDLATLSGRRVQLGMRYGF